MIGPTMDKATGKGKLVSRKGLIIDLVLAAIWFVFFAFILRPYVPAQSETTQIAIAIFTSACLTGVFWLALSMFRVVRVDQMQRAND